MIFGRLRPRFAYSGIRKRQPLTTIQRWSLGVIFVLALSPLLGFVYTYTRAGESARVHAATASTLNFQARLMNGSGSLVADGNYSIEFRLYTAVAAGTNEWTETQSVAVKNGYFNVYLGNVTPFPGTIDWSQEKWLTMNVNSDGEMTPRIKLTAVPYAFRSGQADSLTISGGAVTGDNLLQKAPGSVQSLNSANAGLRFNQTGAGGLIQLQGNGSDVFTVDKSGNTVLGGSLQIGTGLTLGNSTSTTSGTLRWTGLDFEGYDGFNWRSLTSGGGLGIPFVSKTKTVDETVAASTAFQDDDELFFAIGANETWNFRFVVQGQSPAAADFKYTITAPSGATCTFGVGDFEGAMSVANLGCGVTSGLIPGNGAAHDMYEITGSVSNGSTSGTVRLQWAQQVASGSSFVRAGSSLEASRSIGASSTAVAFIQDGNTQGVDAVLGTNDNFALNFETNGVTQLTLGTNGNLDIVNGALQTAGTTRITNAGLLQNVTADTNILTSGTLGVPRGGTGAGTFTTNGVLYGNGAGALQATGAGTDAQLLVANGSGVPTFVSLGGDATISNTGSLTIANGAISNTKLANSSFGLAYGTNLSGDASVSLGGTLNLAISATPTFTSVTTGSLTSSSALSVASTGANNLTLNSGSGTVSLGATTIQTADSLTADLVKATDSVLTIQNSGAGIANLNLGDGSLQTAGTTRLTSGGALQNITGLGVTSGGASIAGGLNMNASGISGVTTLSASGAITAATTVNTINGLIINSGSLSGVTGYGQTSGAFSVTGSGGITIGGGSNALTIDSTNFDVSSAGALSGITSINASGAITAATATNTINGLVINSGSLSGITGLSQTSGNFSVTGSGSIDIGGGSNALTINSTNFDVTSAGAVSGITTLNASGAITAATATNTINGLVISSGSLSSINGFSQGAGNFAVSGTGTFGTGSGAVSLNGATTINTSTNSATALTINGTSGTAATALQIAQTGNAANLALTNTARTSGALVSLTQSTSAFTGTGLLFNFASSSGSFASGNFLDFQLNGTTRFKIDNTGAMQINSDSAVALQVRSASGVVSLFTVNDSGNLVQIGSSTADATGILFVLDGKTGADPTGVDGGSYYNASDSASRCFENGFWSDCASTRILGETTLASANATINVAIPANLEYLKCRVDIKGRSANGFIRLRFNNDSGAASYGWNEYDIIATAVGDAQDSSDSEIQLTGTDTTNIAASANLEITNFADTTKIVDWSYSGATGIGTNNRHYNGTGNWANTTNQITSVQFSTSAGTINAGSHAWCEGRDIR